MELSLRRYLGVCWDLSELLAKISSVTSLKYDHHIKHSIIQAWIIVSSIQRLDVFICQNRQSNSRQQRVMILEHLMCRCAFIAYPHRIPLEFVMLCRYSPLIQRPCSCVEVNENSRRSGAHRSGEQRSPWYEICTLHVTIPIQRWSISVRLTRQVYHVNSCIQSHG